MNIHREIPLKKRLSKSNIKETNYEMEKVYVILDVIY